VRRCLILLCLLGPLAAADVIVGAGRGFLRIEDGLKALKEGDTLLIHPRADGEPYVVGNLRIDLPGITLRGGQAGANELVRIRGDPTRPGSLITFGPEAHGGTVESLHLSGARAPDNAETSAAAVEILGADRCTITACVLTDNDCGVRTSGDAAQMRNFLIQDCHLHHNGMNADLGGYEARLLGCRSEDSLLGANIRSRNHRLLVEACVIQRGADYELDLLDAAGVTDRDGGYAFILGSVLAKATDTPAARGVMRVGADKKSKRQTPTWLLQCTLVHGAVSPLIDLGAPASRVSLVNCLIVDPSGGGSGRQLVARHGRGPQGPDFVGGCWLPFGYSAPAGARAVTVGGFGELPPVREVRSDWRLRDDAPAPFRDGGLEWTAIPMPIAVLRADHPLRQRPAHIFEPKLTGGHRERPTHGPMDIGAFEWTPQP